MAHTSRGFPEMLATNSRYQNLESNRMSSPRNSRQHERIDSRQGLLGSVSEKASDLFTSSPTRRLAFIYPYRHILRAIPAILSGLIWASLMIYFLIYYLTLPPNPEHPNVRPPRIGPAYSTWPYISCIGAIRLHYFQAFAISVAITTVVAFTLEFQLGRRVRAGWWLRRIKLALAYISSVFLIALSFESVNAGNHLHLIFTSIQIWCIGAAKFTDYTLNAKMRKIDPRNPHLKFSQKWMLIISAFTLPTAPITIIGIYACQIPVGLRPPSDTCYKLVSVSAPCEWLLACCWIMYLESVAFELYHGEAIAATISSLEKKLDPGSGTSKLLQLRLANMYPMASPATAADDDNDMEEATPMVPPSTSSGDARRSSGTRPPNIPRIVIDLEKGEKKHSYVRTKELPSTFEEDLANDEDRRYARFGYDGDDESDSDSEDDLGMIEPAEKFD